MQITYWEGFSKRKNSTKRPSGAGTTIDVHLKEDTSREHPSFQLSGHNYNMNYVQAFGDYYYVEDIISLSNGISEIVCTMDPMATAKTEIGATKAMVEYTSSSTNILLTDPRNKPSNAIIESHTDLLDLSSYGFTAGDMFILGVAGGTGGVTYYEMDALKLRAVFNAIYDPSFFQTLENQFFDMKSCIVSCIRIPALPTAETGADAIMVAGQSIGISATIVPRYASIAETSYDITFPFGDGIWAEGSENYVDYAYSTGTLYLPFVGVVPLDIDVVAHSRQIRIGAEVDWCTGAIVYKLANASGDFISTYEGHFASGVPIVSQTYNALGTAAGIIGVIGGGVSAVAGVGAISGTAFAAQQSLGLGAVLGGVGSSAMMGSGIINNLALHTQVNGSISSSVGNRLGRKAVATVITRTPSEPDLRQFRTVLGMPFFQVATISSLSGYVQCSGASVSSALNETEKEIINGYLNSGFYYE